MIELKNLEESKFINELQSNIKDLNKIIATKEKIIEKQQIMVEIAKDYIKEELENNGYFMITKANKIFQFEKGQIINYAKSLELISKKRNVLKTGRKYFTTIHQNKEDKFKIIVLTEEGLKWVADKQDEIRQLKPKEKEQESIQLSIWDL